MISHRENVSVLVGVSFMRGGVEEGTLVEALKSVRFIIHDKKKIKGLCRVNPNEFVWLHVKSLGLPFEARL